MKISKIKKPKLRLWFCGIWFPEEERYMKGLILYLLISDRFEIVLDSKNPDFLIYSIIRYSKMLDYNCPKIFWSGENSSPNYGLCDFGVSFDSDKLGKNYYFPFFAWWPTNLLPLTNPRDNKIKKTSFCNFIYTHKVPLRENFFHLLCKYKKVDSAGGRLNNTLSGEKVKDKLAFMRPYKFSIAFENSSFAGYTTEKIVHAFVANTVPIYYGDPYITKHFNPKAFINCHDFENFESVVEHIKKVDQDDELLNSYLQEPPFVGNQRPENFNQERLKDTLENFFQNPPKKPASRSIYFKTVKLLNLLNFLNLNLLRCLHKRKKRYASKGVKFITNKF